MLYLYQWAADTQSLLTLCCPIHFQKTRCFFHPRFASLAVLLDSCSVYLLCHILAASRAIWAFLLFEPLWSSRQIPPCCRLLVIFGLCLNLDDQPTGVHSCTVLLCPLRRLCHMRKHQCALSPQSQRLAFRVQPDLGHHTFVPQFACQCTWCLLWNPCNSSFAFPFSNRPNPNSWRRLWTRHALGLLLQKTECRPVSHCNAARRLVYIASLPCFEQGQLYRRVLILDLYLQ